MDNERLLVCGSRNFGDKELMRLKIDAFIRNIGKPTVIICGEARGADCLAEQLAQEFDITATVYHADWDKYGKRAGYLRNERMLIEGKPTYVMAFYHDKDAPSPGTSHMTWISTEAHVPVFTFYENEPYPVK